MRGLVLTLLVLLLFSGFWLFGVSALQIQPHSSILIDGNEGFTRDNGVTRGSGTVSNPYIIEGWWVEGPGIKVRNTNVHFEIRNVDAVEILLEKVANAVIEGSTVSSIFIHFSTDVRVVGNQFFTGEISGGTRETEGEVSIGIASSVDIAISGNIIIANSGYPTGIFFNDDVGTKNVIVSNNIIRGFWFGIDTQTLAGPITISNNEISGNVYGIQVGAGGSITHEQGLLIHQNNFIENEVHAYFWETGGTAFSWDSDYPAGGNYWSGYEGLDKCNGPRQDVCTGPDGIGDSPRAIPVDCYLPCPVESSIDRYPLMSPIPIISATMSLSPGVVGSRNMGKFLTVSFQLSREYDVTGMDSLSIRLNHIPIVPGTLVRNHAGWLVKFDLQDVKTLFQGPGVYTLKLTGHVAIHNSLPSFEALGTIKVN